MARYRAPLQYAATDATPNIAASLRRFHHHQPLGGSTLYTSFMGVRSLRFAPFVVLRALFALFPSFAGTSLRNASKKLNFEPNRTPGSGTK